MRVKGSWTARLAVGLATPTLTRSLPTSRSAAQALAGERDAVRVRMDGPYRHLSADPARYGLLILVAGGVGVTPMIGCLRRLAEQVVRAAPAHHLQARG